MDYVPISTLKPNAPPPADGSIRAVVSLSWPYSSSTKQCALLLADPDFRLRNRKGQVRVRFGGPAAEAVAKSKICIGDEVLLELQGARWAEDTGNPRTPGRSVDGELVFAGRLALKLMRDGGEREIRVNEATPPRSADQDNMQAAPSLNGGVDLVTSFDSMPEDGPVYASPAYVKKLRLSESSFFGSDQDPFQGGEDDSPRSQKRQRLSYSGIAQWRYAKTTPPLSSEPHTFTHVSRAEQAQSNSLVGSHDGTTDMAPQPVIPAESHGQKTVNGVSPPEWQSRGIVANAVGESSAMSSLSPPRLQKTRMQDQGSAEENVLDQDDPSRPVLQPLSSANPPLALPLLADGSQQLSEPPVVEGEIPPIAETEREIQPISKPIRHEIPDTYDETQAALFSPVRDAGETAWRAGKERVQNSNHAVAYNGYEENVGDETEDVEMTDATAVDDIAKSLQVPSGAGASLLSNLELDDVDEIAAPAGAPTKEILDDDRVIEDSANVRYDDEIEESHDASGIEHKVGAHDDDELPTEAIVLERQDANVKLIQGAVKESNRKNYDEGEEQVSVRPSYLSSHRPQHRSSKGGGTTRPKPFGRDGTSTLGDPLTPKTTPKLERESRMAATYNSLFGFRSSTQSDATPSQVPKGRDVNVKAFMEAAHTFVLPPSLDQSPIINVQGTAALSNPADYEAWTASPTTQLHVPSVEVDTNAEIVEPNDEEAELPDPIIGDSVTVLQDAFQRDITPNHMQSRSVEVIDLSSSSDEDEPEDDDANVDEGSLLSPSPAVADEARTLLEEVAPEAIPSPVDTTLIGDAIYLEDTPNPVQQAQEAVVEVPSSPQRMVEAGSSILDEIQPTPPSQRRKSVTHIIEDSFPLHIDCNNTNTSLRLESVLIRAKDNALKSYAHSDLAEASGSMSLKPYAVVDAGSAILDELQQTPPSQRVAADISEHSADLMRSESPSPEFRHAGISTTEIAETGDDDVVMLDADNEQTPIATSSPYTSVSLGYPNDVAPAEEQEYGRQEQFSQTAQHSEQVDEQADGSGSPASSSFVSLSSTPSPALVTARSPSEVEELDLSQVEPSYSTSASQQHAMQTQIVPDRRDVIYDSFGSRATTLVPESSRPTTKDGVGSSLGLNDAATSQEQWVMPSQELGTLGLSQPSRNAENLESMSEEHVTSSPLNSPTPVRPDDMALVHNELDSPNAPVASSPVEADEVDDKPYCYCREPILGNMTGCDNEDCEYQWFHLGCLGLKKVPEGDWICQACQGRQRPSSANQDGSHSSTPEMVEDTPSHMVGAGDGMMAEPVQEYRLLRDGQGAADALDPWHWETQVSHAGERKVELQLENGRAAGKDKGAMADSGEDANWASPEPVQPASEAVAGDQQLEHGRQDPADNLFASHVAFERTTRELLQTPMQAISYPSLPMSPSLSQSQPSQPCPASHKNQHDTMTTVLPPTPQLTQVESSGVVLPEAPPEQLMAGPTRRSTGRKSLTGRLSGVPEALSAWFTPRRSRGGVREERTNDDGGNAQLAGRNILEATVQQSDEQVKTSLGKPIINGMHTATHSQAISQPLRERFRRSSTGLGTPLSYYTSLGSLDRLVNTPSQSFDKITIDVIAVVTDGTKKPERAEAGPRDFFTIFQVSEPGADVPAIAAAGDEADSNMTNGDTAIELHAQSKGNRVAVFRPWKASLPYAEPGDVVLLRSFVVKSRKRAPYLLSCDTSAWCVWRFGQSSELDIASQGKAAWAKKHSNSGVKEEVKGPPIEVGEQERARVMQLRTWWEATKHDEAVVDGSDAVSKEELAMAQL